MPPTSSPKESAASSPKESTASSPMLRDLTRARPWYMIGLPNASSRVGPMDHEALPCQVMSCYMMLWYVYLCHFLVTCTRTRVNPNPRTHGLVPTGARVSMG